MKRLQIFAFIVILVALTSFSHSFDAAESKTLNISIYIESYCKYSRKFVQEQLLPVFDIIEPNVNINYVPFGAAEVMRKL